MPEAYFVEGNGKIILERVRKAFEEKNNTLLVFKIRWRPQKKEPANLV